MRILMMSHGYPPTVSGVTLVTQKIAGYMVKRGHSVAVITASDRGTPYNDDDHGVRLIRLRSMHNPFWTNGPLPLISRKQLRALIDSFRPDIIHSHDNAMICVQLLRLSANLATPLVTTCHYLPRFVNQYTNWDEKLDEIGEAIAWNYCIRLLNQFDHVIFPTLTQHQAFARHGLKVPATIISNGVDPTHYHQRIGQEADIVSRYNLPPGPRILFVGRLAKDKDIDVLIRAMPLVWATQKAHLLLVGCGDDRSHLERLAAELSLQDCVHFLGFVPEEDLPAIYRAVDLFAIASVCEVQSIPTLQAVASGLPIVAARAAALPELVQDQVNGILVPPGNTEAMSLAFLRILCQPLSALRFGKASLAISRVHEEALTFSAHESLYRRLLSPRPDSREMAALLAKQQSEFRPQAGRLSKPAAR